MDSLPGDLGIDLEKWIEDTDGMSIAHLKELFVAVVILGDDITAMQMKLVAKKTGIYEWERYIDASSHLDWEELGMNWIINGIDPDDITKSSAACMKSQ